jgi:hypothetical protein
MKQFILLNIIIINSLTGNTQGLGNIFNQKAADLKSMGKQIALLQLYIGWIEKGYSIARSGLTLIGDIKQGELNLHTVFFGSLSSVNPEIKKCSKVAAIIVTIQAITKELNKISSVQNISTGEMQYLITVKGNLLEDCAKMLDDLISVITDDSYQMTDDERIKRIDGIYSDVNSKWVLVKDFTDEASMISVQRQADRRDIKTLQNIE